MHDSRISFAKYALLGLLSMNCMWWLHAQLATTEFSYTLAINLYTLHIFWQGWQLTIIIQSICTNENVLFQNSYSRNANMGFHFWSLPTRSAFTKLQKAKVKQMHCTACHESRSLVLTGGTSATDVSREGTMCILWVPQRLLPHPAYRHAHKYKAKAICYKLVHTTYIHTFVL